MPDAARTYPEGLVQEHKPVLADHVQRPLEGRRNVRRYWYGIEMLVYIIRWRCEAGAFKDKQAGPSKSMAGSTTEEEEDKGFVLGDLVDDFGCLLYPIDASWIQLHGLEHTVVFHQAHACPVLYGYCKSIANQVLPSTLWLHASRSHWSKQWNWVMRNHTLLLPNEMMEYSAGCEILVSDCWRQ